MSAIAVSHEVAAAAPIARRSEWGFSRLILSEEAGAKGDLSPRLAVLQYKRERERKRARRTFHQAEEYFWWSLFKRSGLLRDSCLLMLFSDLVQM